MDNEKLIKAINLRNSLWDRSSASYNDKKVKEDEWQEVAAEMNLTLTEVKNKWKLLRDSFNRELRTVSKRQSKNGEVVSRWVYFNQMLFLKDAIKAPLIVENTTENIKKELQPQIVSVVTLREPNNHKIESDKKKRKIISKKQETNNQPEVEINQPECGQCKEHKSEDFYFLMSLLPTLEQLPKREKMLAKMEIQRVLFTATFDSPTNSEEILS